MGCPYHGSVADCCYRKRAPEPPPAREVILVLGVVAVLALVAWLIWKCVH